MHWETLEHPLYSPDLSPCDYFLFAAMKKSLGGDRFVNNDEVEEHVRNWLTMRPQTFFNKECLSSQIVGKSVPSVQEAM